MLRELFDSLASRQPRVLALIDGPTRLCYADLMARSGRFARYLVEEVGVRRGDYIAACLPNSWEFAVGFFAVAGIGAAWVPIPPQWRGREVAWLAGRIPLRALITTAALEQAWREAAVSPPPIVRVDDPAIRERLLSSAAPLPASPSASDEVSVCITTSGSTGRPRLVPRTQANLLSSALGAAAALGVRPGTRMLSVVPFHSSAGNDVCMLLPLLSGLTSVVLSAFTPAAAESLVVQERIQFMMGSPFVYSMLLESNASRASFESVEIALTGGAPMAPDTARRAEQRLGLSLRQIYGLTETGIASLQPADTPFQPGFVGPPIPPMQVHIMDERGQRLDPGCTGEVLLGGPGIAHGYLDEPALNRELFRDGFFRTGDLGQLDASGALTLCGRFKTLINLGGNKVDPAEIEHVLLEMPAVRDSVVRGVHDPQQGEIVCASIAVRPGFELSRQAVVAHCRQRMAEFKIPRRIEFVDALPVDATGKKPQRWRDS